MVLLAMFVSTILSFCFGVFGYFLSAKASLRCTCNLRNNVYEKILTYSFQEFNVVTPPSLITRLTNDAQKVQQSLQMTFSLLIQAPFTLIGTSILIFTATNNLTTNISFGCLSLGFMSMIILMVGLIGRIATPLFDHAQRTIDETSTVIRENSLGARVVRSFNLQQHENAKMSLYNSKLRNLSLKVEIWIGSVSVVIEFIIFGGIAIIYLISGFIINSDTTTLTTPTIYQIVNTMLIQLMSFVMFIMAIIIVIRSKPSANRIYNLLLIVPSIINPKQGLKFNPNNYDIVFKNVSYKYSSDAKSEIIKNINLTIKTGETIGIIGVTGSGKTTLVDLIPRLYDPTIGTVTIGGKNIKNIDLHELRQNIGISLQDQTLFSGDIAYNLRYGKADATEKEMQEACQLSCA